MPDEPQNTEINGKIKNIDNLLVNKEYDKVIRACQEILDQDPTNQTALSLLKEAHDLKMTALRSSMAENRPTGISLPPLISETLETPSKIPPSSTPENQPSTQTPPTPPFSVPIPEPQTASKAASEEDKTTPETNGHESTTPAPQSLEEIFSQPKVQLVEATPTQPPPLETTPPHQETPTVAEQKIQPEQNTQPYDNKKKIIDIAVKVILALVLMTGVYYTYKIYISPNKTNEPQPAEGTLQTDENIQPEKSEKQPEEENNADENSFVVSPEEESAETKPEEDTTPTDQDSTSQPETEEPAKKKVRRVPAEEETKEMY